MDLPAFRAKWRAVTLTERSASQSHFLDLCALFGVAPPVEADPRWEWFTFEKGAAKATGGKGWADVWRRGAFAWEYKGHHADLAAAFRQLQLYRDDLENPPLLVVCDLDRFEVHTNFTGTAPDIHRFDLAGLDDPANYRVLRAVFLDPLSLRPKRTPDDVTQEAAERFGALAAALTARGEDPRRVAHFLVQLLFCLFAEDVGLLPRGLFAEVLAGAAKRPERFPDRAAALLGAMRDGGDFGAAELARFNGGLFAEAAPLALTGDELAGLAAASRLDWSSVEPAIFGTLFERSLDPDQRAQLGAHYTGRKDIERVVEPVLMVPLRRRWETVRVDADRLRQASESAPTVQTRRNRQADLARLLGAFQDELAGVRVLDPACGSGNFLYVALAALLDLEKEVVAFGTAAGLPALLPRVGPRQLAGLEINAYAHELAQAVVWIGYLQWLGNNGFPPGSRDPILEPLETIRLQDALLDRSDPTRPTEAAWPAADYIIGNPPFLGDKKMRGELAGDYVDDLWYTFRGRVPGGADLVCYFFEKARAEIAARRTDRAGLLGTNSIRGGANRRVLERIKQSGDIFMAWKDEPWILDGAAVRIAIVGFDGGSTVERVLDGKPVATINADLTGETDVTTAKQLRENLGLSFIGDQKSGPFDVSDELARSWLLLPPNPNGRRNSDVVRPWVNGLDLTKRPRSMWIVDFGVAMPEQEAALYEAPFEYVREHVKPLRDMSRTAARTWWLHERPRGEMRAALADLPRYLATARNGRHRLWVWLTTGVLPDSQVVAVARDDDWFFGVLHSRAHEVWSLRLGTWLGWATIRATRRRPASRRSRCPGRRGPNRPRIRAFGRSRRRRRTWIGCAATGSTPRGRTPSR